MNSHNIVTLPLKTSWIEAGLRYSLISWSSTFNRMGKPNPYSRMEKIVIGIIAEKAVEAYMQQEGVKFDTTGRTRWYEEDRYDLGFKSYALDVKSNYLDVESQHISRQLNDMFTDPDEWLRGCTALVPLDQFNPGSKKSRKHDKEKVYIFAFIEGTIKHTRMKHPLVHAFWDYKWLKKGDHAESTRVGKVKIVCDTKRGAIQKLRLVGTTDPQRGQTEDIILKNPETLSEYDFYQLFSVLWLGDYPPGKLVLKSTRMNKKETIEPELTFELTPTEDGYTPIANNWQSLVFEKCAAHLVGWITEKDLRMKGKKIPRFTHTLRQYAETKTDNWGCLVKELRPMNEIGSLK